MKSILFETHHLYYVPNFLPIIQEFRRRGGYSLSASIPLTINAQERRQLKEAVEMEQLEFINADSESERQAKLRQRQFAVVIVGIPGMLERVVSPETVAVMVYHGIGLKESYYRDASPRINIRAVESQPRFQELRRRGESNLILTGYTKIDPLSEIKPRQRETHLQALGLPKSRPTVLYAPTFYPSSVEKMLPHLPRLAESANVIIKLHGFSWSQRRYSHQSKAAQEVAGGGVCLIPREDYDIVPFYAVADLLISDISSTLFEYLALNRPILQTTFNSPRLKHRIFKSRLRRRLDVERSEEIDFTHRLDRPDNLSAVVHDILRNSDEMSPQRHLAAKRFLFRTDGKASARLVDAIEEKLD
ncbi:MAG: hypothetical protein CMG71_04280 [Candidatus Marinimicrobia bacterium]|nr:hypothetical protein [Candidatus Neomarinimicrobiota bacterium]|tara:strand:- start:1452 stop:2531 length:1080 start_codon:yes stop_codon:yes gene_type:complete